MNLIKKLIIVFSLSFLFSEKNIKTKTEYRYRIENNSEENFVLLFFQSTSKYNNNNDLVEIITDDFDEDISFKKIYRYDSNHNEIGFMFYDSSGKSEFVEKLIYNPDREELFTYDSNNNISEKIETDETGLVNKTTYKYDSNNNIIEESYLDFCNPNSDFRIVYKYDINNNLIERENFTTSFRTNYKSIYIYDLYNNVIEERNYIPDYSLPGNPKEELVTKIIYEYEYYN